MTERTPRNPYANFLFSTNHDPAPQAGGGSKPLLIFPSQKVIRSELIFLRQFCAHPSSPIRTKKQILKKRNKKAATYPILDPALKVKDTVAQAADLGKKQ